MPDGAETIETTIGGNCGSNNTDLVDMYFPDNDFVFQKLLTSLRAPA